MIGRDIWAVVPVKAFAGAKQRLSPAFDPHFRRALAAIMVEDVLSVLARSRSLAGILVVTADEDARRLAGRYGARTIDDGAAGGHTAAVASGAGALLASGCAGMLSLPGDIPGVTAAEIEALIAAHDPGSPAFTIVPAHDWRGSNAIVATPPDAVPLAYGNDSFLPHLAACRGLGIEPKVVEFAGIGLDVDAPEDLHALFLKGWPTRTQAFLQGSGLFPRLPEATHDTERSPLP